MAFTTNLTGTAQISNSIVLAFDQQFILSAAQMQIMDQFATYKQDIGAKSIQLTKYSQLALATTPLTETDDPVSAALVDANILFTPVEYGNVVTTTKLANLQSGGKADLAAAKLVGINLGRTMDKLAITALEAGTNVSTVTGGAVSAFTASNIMTRSYLNQMYNKLARANIAPLADGMYVAVMHDDVIADLRADTSTGSWTDVTKYSDPQTVLKNEVGMISGFRVVRDNHITIGTDLGASGVDSYKTLCMGYNALGKAVSKEPEGVLTGPFDKLNRFVNVGWHGVLAYGVVDQAALWVAQSASSVGTNGVG